MHILAQPSMKSSFLSNNEKQGRKRPLDTPKRKIERRERDRKIEKERERGR